MAPSVVDRYHLQELKQGAAMVDHVWQWIAAAVLLLLAALNPHAASGAAFGCCFFLAFPSASRGLQRLLYGVFSWGIGYASGVFFYGEGPPYNQKSMLIAATMAAVAVLIFVAWGSIIRQHGKLPPWAEAILDIVFPFRAKRGKKNAD